MRVAIVGASGKLGRYMVQHALDRGYEVTGVCREQSIARLDRFNGRITVVPGATGNHFTLGIGPVEVVCLHRARHATYCPSKEKGVMVRL